MTLHTSLHTLLRKHVFHIEDKFSKGQCPAITAIIGPISTEKDETIDVVQSLSVSASTAYTNSPATANDAFGNMMTCASDMHQHILVAIHSFLVNIRFKHLFNFVQPMLKSIG